MTAVSLCKLHQMVVKSMLCSLEVTYCGIQLVIVKEKTLRELIESPYSSSQRQTIMKVRATLIQEDDLAPQLSNVEYPCLMVLLVRDGRIDRFLFGNRPRLLSFKGKIKKDDLPLPSN